MVEVLHLTGWETIIVPYSTKFLSNRKVFLVLCNSWEEVNCDVISIIFIAIEFLHGLELNTIGRIVIEVILVQLICYICSKLLKHLTWSEVALRRPNGPYSKEHIYILHTFSDV